MKLRELLAMAFHGYLMHDFDPRMRALEDYAKRAGCTEVKLYALGNDRWAWFDAKRGGLPIHFEARNLPSATAALAAVLQVLRVPDYEATGPRASS